MFTSKVLPFLSNVWSSAIALPAICQLSLCHKIQPIHVDKYILLYQQIHFEIWTNTFYNLTNISCNVWSSVIALPAISQICCCHKIQLIHVDKYILQFQQIHFTIWTNISDILDKYVLQSLIISNILACHLSALLSSQDSTNTCGQIYLTISTNTICNLEKYIGQFGQICFAKFNH